VEATGDELGEAVASVLVLLQPRMATEAANARIARDEVRRSNRVVAIILNALVDETLPVTFFGA
jgi:hypothetical protein